MCLGSHQANVLATPEVVIVPSLPRFVANEYFTLGTSKNRRARIYGLGDNFKRWFLEGAGKIEVATTPMAISYRTIEAKATDELLLNELGGNMKAELRLSQVAYFMDEQYDGKDGALLVDRESGGKLGSLFLARDIKNILRIVYVSWRDTAWAVIAVPTADDNRPLCHGNRIFSRY